MIEYVFVPSAMPLSTPVIVTNCVKFQLPGVNVTEVGEGTPSEELELERLIVTLSIGGVASTMAKLAEPPALVVCSPWVSVSCTPGSTCGPDDCTTLIWNVSTV